MFIFGGEGLNVSFGDGARYNLEQDAWAPLLLQGAAPSSRTCASAIWTGGEMIIWGGFGGSDAEDINRNDGARFDPINNVWRRVSTAGAPSARFNQTAIWTGQEMLVWGGFGGTRAQLAEQQSDGYLNTGGRYNPATDTWREINTNGAPSQRFNPAGVWTGREMLIWGGSSATGAANDGARYDPANDKWKPIRSEGAPGPRATPLAVWTGKEMIVWGGHSSGAGSDAVYFQDGARYNPETDTWTPLPTHGAPKARAITQAVWTGTELVFWGGVNDAGTSGLKDPNRYVGTGARYNPVTDKWTEIPTRGAPTPRVASAVVWTGKGLLLFGGYHGKHLNDTYYYLPKP
jgi:N-acetylneuraminic acid mutarotase